MCAEKMLICFLTRMLSLHLLILFSDREAVQELDAHLKETRKSAGEKVRQFNLTKICIQFTNDAVTEGQICS